MNKLKKIFLVLAASALVLSGCGEEEDIATVKAGGSFPEAVNIELSDEGIQVDGAAVSENPQEAVYAARDVVFYLANQGFTYGEGTEADEHTQEEADANTVVHITKPGTYAVTGKLSAGQIAIDLGEEAENDPKAVVTLILNGVDITCKVAPAVIFYNVYECNTADAETASHEVDTQGAGANVMIADNSVNQVNGSYVARIYKTYTLNEDGTEVVDYKKLHKYDGAFYSKMSMNVNGEKEGNGVLNIKAENEGLDSEMHLTINGGRIYITSGNDGINTNEDGISVTTINDGEVKLFVDGSTGEGDGIDSNGWLVINGGTVIAAACSRSGDAGIDSDRGIYINGGNIVASGNMMDRIAGGEQSYVLFAFAENQAGGSTYTMKNAEHKEVASWTPKNDFVYLLVADDNLTEGTYTLWNGKTQLAASAGMGSGEPPQGMELPEGMEIPEGGESPQGMELPEGMEIPEGGEPPQGMERPQGEDNFVDRGKGGQGGRGSRQAGMGFGGQEYMNSGDLSEEFVITERVTYFSKVQAKAEE